MSELLTRERDILSLLDLANERKQEFATVEYLGIDYFYAQPFWSHLDKPPCFFAEALNEYRLSRVIRGEVSQNTAILLSEIEEAATKWRAAVDYRFIIKGVSAAKLSDAKKIGAFISKRFEMLGFHSVSTENTNKSVLFYGRKEFLKYGSMGVSLRLRKTSVGRLTFNISKVDMSTFGGMLELGSYDVSAQCLFDLVRIEIPDKGTAINHDETDFEKIDNFLHFLEATLNSLAF